MVFLLCLDMGGKSTPTNQNGNDGLVWPVTWMRDRWINCWGIRLPNRIAVEPQQGRKVFALQTLPACDSDGQFADTVGKVAGFRGQSTLKPLSKKMGSSSSYQTLPPQQFQYADPVFSESIMF